MLALVGDLVGSKHTAVAKDAACHVQLYLIADVDLFKCTAVKFIAGFLSTMIVT